MAILRKKEMVLLFSSALDITQILIKPTINTRSCINTTYSQNTGIPRNQIKDGE
jgi:hypothetical protein